MFYHYLFTIMCLFCIIGCVSDNKENSIEICNNDNREYIVKLHRHSNDKVVKEISVGEAWDLADRCEYFKDVDEDRYYITIHLEDAVTPSSTTSEFYIDDNDHEYFTIDSTGEIYRDNDAKITVCNNDNREYIVQLHNAKTEELIQEFTLGEIWDLQDRCDDFKGVSSGQYYISIQMYSMNGYIDTTSDFSYEVDEYEYFIIDTTSTIKPY